jgi:Uma2 family endonuclease
LRGASHRRVPVGTETHEVTRRRFTVHDYHRRAGIPEVWIVDLRSEIIERHTDPSKSSYRRVERARRGEALAPLTFSELTLRADAVLG